MFRNTIDVYFGYLRMRDNVQYIYINEESRGGGEQKRVFGRV